ncbi:hypothetical protein [Aquabacterium sp. A08]|uniref:hypothetical protein n=1 Tax=Aquabacterium sp. A08 TaxID=2718532 RepID=UPI00141DEA4B|nr:hypothetical protein [Aquabacterium sp. A08]NIC41690.1 hypothetical protein [Aquabacterium sp. A08]NIC41708.1 hypothetical protein [Aquabacterium sp. A08]
MALPWLAALKVIPWGDVIEHAPAVLKGARRLLDRQPTTPPPPTQAPTDADTLAQQLAALQRQHASDMAQLTQTVAELAEQNTRLVEAVDVLRWRTRWLGAATLVLLIGGVALALWGR